MGYNKDKERQQYIEFHHLQDSYIDKNILYQSQNVLPERKYVGRTENGDKIFFEETSGSVVKRNYGKSEVVTSWNLLISHNEKSELMTKEKMKILNIVYYDGYSKEYLMNFLEKNNKRNNALNPSTNERKRYTIWADAEEFEIIQDFIKKLREQKDGKINIRY